MPFKLKQKNLQGRVEMFCAANKEKEVWDLKVLWCNMSGTGQRGRASQDGGSELGI